MRNKLTIALLITLTIVISIYAKENQQPKITEYPLDIMEVTTGIQFSKKFTVIDDDCGVSIQLSLIDRNDNNIALLLLVNYIRKDNAYYPPRFLTDGHENIKYVGSMSENKQHLFELKMYQWFYYMNNGGLDGEMYIPETDSLLNIQIPEEYFREIDYGFRSFIDG